MDASDDRFEVDQDEYELLCQRAGHLFIMFARLEGTLAAMLRLHLVARMGATLGELSSIEDAEAADVASAVYGSMRYQAAKDAIKRMIVIQRIPLDVRENIDLVFNQIGEIQKFRDLIAHQQLMRFELQKPHFWCLSNIVTTKSILSRKVLEFHVDIIADSTDDLKVIHDLFGRGPVVGTDIIPDPERFLVPPTWRYKPSLLAQIDPSNLGTHR